MKKKFFDSFIALCLTFALVFTASVLPASADSATVIYATSPDGYYKYTSIQTAWDAVKNGYTIVMQCDWNLSDRLVLNGGQTGTVYMNGYKIDRGLTKSTSDGEVIYMNAGSSLTLKGYYENGESKTGTEFKVKGLDLNGEASGTLTSGGLITGGYSSNGAGGIHMKKNAKLTLDNVIVGGNKVSNNYGGGVNMNNSGDSLTLKNGAKIAYNVATCGGGVYVADSSCNISLYGGSTIEYNYARESGGGIYSNATSTTVKLNGSSSISNNIACDDGGGYYGNYSYNTIESSDKTGSMSYNTASDSGGAIFFESVNLRENENSISGICFEGNTCWTCGGAMYLNQEWVKVKDCIIKKNSATSTSGMGGGVYNVNDNNTFANCTITDNYAAGYGGGIYEGVYNNIRLSGKVIIKNNTRADGTLDDLYLSNHPISTAYIVSNPDAGSEIGIKIYADGNKRKIGEGTELDETIFFSDTQGYYIRYDSAAKEMYLIPNDSQNASYSVTVNGKLQGYYNADAKLTIDGTPSDSSKAFKEWDGDWTALDSKTKAVASVSMSAKKDLSFTSENVTRVSNFTLEVKKPVAGSALPTYGKLIWQGDVTTVWQDVDVYWLIQNDEGTTQTASGTADYSTNYSVAAVIDEDPSENLAFADADTVTGTVKYTTDTEEEIQTYRVYVDDTQSTLYMYGNQIQTEKANIESVAEANVSIAKDSTVDALKKALPQTAEAYDAKLNEYTVNLDTEHADLSAVVTADSKVNNNGGKVVIPLKLDGTENVKNDNDKKLVVNVDVVAEGKLSVPTAAPGSGTYTEKGDDGKVTLNIKLTADDGATIYYKINDATDFNAYDSNTGITISAAEGTKESFIVRTYAGDKSGYVDSTVAAYTYVLDNPYTVTVTKKSIASQDGQAGPEIGEKYIAQYYQGDSVIIGAPLVSGYVFDKWQRQTEDGMIIDDSNEQSNKLTKDGIQNSISLTALYNPVAKPTDTEPDTSTKPSASHHSNGSKVTDQKADTTIDQTETIKEKVAALELAARSSKTPKKNIKVVLKMSAEAQATIDEIQSLGYTVKYKFYRSTKKAASYKATLTGTSGKYTNTIGKKGTMYYYKARVQVYDANGNLVTQTALKQCKYANRQWTK